MMWLHASNSTATAMYGLPWLQGKANVFGYRRLLFSYTTNQPVSQPTPFFYRNFYQTKCSCLSMKRPDRPLFLLCLWDLFVCLSV